MFQYDEKGVENMLLRIAVCDDEAIHRLIIRDKLDAYAISNDIDYELDEFTNSKELMKMENIYDILFLDVQWHLQSYWNHRCSVNLQCHR